MGCGVIQSREEVKEKILQSNAESFSSMNIESVNKKRIGITDNPDNGEEDEIEEEEVYEHTIGYFNIDKYKSNYIVPIEKKQLKRRCKTEEETAESEVSSKHLDTIKNTLNNKSENEEEEKSKSNSDSSEDIEVSFDSEDTKTVKLHVLAVAHEILYPVWITKGESVTFNVEGKWKINENTECDCNGIIGGNAENNQVSSSKGNKEKKKTSKGKKSSSVPKFNQGALLGRILRGKYFNITNGLVYKSNISGPIFLKMNLPTYYNNKPSGSLLVTITGTDLIDSEELEKKIGWGKRLRHIQTVYENDIFNNAQDINNIIVVKPKKRVQYQFTRKEKKFMILLNRCRYFPELFASHYLYNLSLLTSRTKNLYKFLIDMVKIYPKFKFNVPIVKEITQFYDTLLEDKEEENNLETMNNSEKALNETIMDKFGKYYDFHIYMIKYEYNKTIQIITRILIDDDIRKDIFNTYYEEVAFHIKELDNNGKKIKYVIFCILHSKNILMNKKVKLELYEVKDLLANLVKREPSQSFRGNDNTKTGKILDVLKNSINKQKKVDKNKKEDKNNESKNNSKINKVKKNQQNKKNDKNNQSEQLSESEIGEEVEGQSEQNNEEGDEEEEEDKEGDNEEQCEDKEDVEGAENKEEEEEEEEVDEDLYCHSTGTPSI